ncbi:MAG: hypothetical protein R3C02_12020 [Planctomycetaceae bacterium]
MTYQRIGAIKTVAAFRELLDELGLELPVDDVPQSAADGSPRQSHCNWAISPSATAGACIRWRVGTELPTDALANTRSAAGNILANQAANSSGAGKPSL